MLVLKAPLSGVGPEAGQVGGSELTGDDLVGDAAVKVGVGW